MTTKFRLEDVSGLSCQGFNSVVDRVTKIDYTGPNSPRCDCNNGSSSPGCSIAPPKPTQEDIYRYAKAA